jgi:2-amino-4,5-dihydroxy-6-oxo-7-(phosphonooxy)heptanoate synthase
MHNGISSEPANRSALRDYVPAARPSPASGTDYGPGQLKAGDDRFAGYHFARAMRLHRLFRHGSKLMIVPLDHSVTDGPIARPGMSIDQLAGDLAASGVDAIVLHKGSLRHVRPALFRAMSLIVHLSASSHHAPDPNAKYLVASVEEAVTLGADAVSVHVNLGSLDERRQIADLGAVAGSCDRWNVPLIAMVYPRGPRIADPHHPELVAHAAAVAADLGADVVKTTYPGSRASMAEVAGSCPIPVIVAGGSPAATTDQVLGFTRDALVGGAAGVAMGRTIFTAPDPRAMAGRVGRLVRHLGAARPGTLEEGA